MLRRRIFASHGGQSLNALKPDKPFVFSHQKGGQSTEAIPSPGSVGHAGPLASALNQEVFRGI